MPSRKRYGHIRRNLVVLSPFVKCILRLVAVSHQTNVQQLPRNAYIYKYYISSNRPTYKVSDVDIRDSEKETHKFHGVGKKVGKWLLLAICTLLSMQTSPATCAAIVLIERVGMAGDGKEWREGMFRALMQWGGLAGWEEWVWCGE